MPSCMLGSGVLACIETLGAAQWGEQDAAAGGDHRFMPSLYCSSALQQGSGVGEKK